MSRIGNKVILITDGVEINIIGQKVLVKGKNGELNHTCSNLISIHYNKEKKELLLKRSNDTKEAKSLHGLDRSLIANMVIGVSEGWNKKLEIVGIGYRSQIKGKVLNLTLGYSHPLNFDIPEGITIKVADNTKIEITGFDKQKVGQVAANIRAYRKPDSYKGKGVRYADEVIVLKEGKSTAK